MATSYFVANWKMNLRRNEQKELIDALKKEDCTSAATTVVVCPSYTNIPYVAGAVGKHMQLGAQDVSWESKGAMTGEVSPDMLKDYEVAYVIIGHSERRYSMDENDDMIQAKVASAVKHDLIPIICVGETFDQRKEGITDVVIAQQVKKALEKVPALSADQKVIIAYEPVWVIGSGQAVDPAEAFHAAAVIRQTVMDMYDEEKEASHAHIPILYGGSIAKDNIGQFVHDAIDGVLVGGASLQAEQFCAMVKVLGAKG